MLGDESTGELLALKRISLRNSMQTSLKFYTPEEPGTYEYRYSFAFLLLEFSYVRGAQLVLDERHIPW